VEQLRIAFAQKAGEARQLRSQNQSLAQQAALVAGLTAERERLKDSASRQAADLQRLSAQKMSLSQQASLVGGLTAEVERLRAQVRVYPGFFLLSAPPRAPVSCMHRHACMHA
jgi:hypothetical protein